MKTLHGTEGGDAWRRHLSDVSELAWSDYSSLRLTPLRPTIWLMLALNEKSNHFRIDHPPARRFCHLLVSFLIKAIGCINLSFDRRRLDFEMKGGWERWRLEQDIRIRSSGLVCLTYQELESDWFAKAKSEHADSVRHLGSAQSFTARATPTIIYPKLKITSSGLFKPILVDSTCLCPRPTEHILVNSCRARTLLLEKLDMTQTEMVKRPEGWSANLNIYKIYIAKYI